MKKPAKSSHHAAVNTPTNSNRDTAPVVIDSLAKIGTSQAAFSLFSFAWMVPQTDFSQPCKRTFALRLQPFRQTTSHGLERPKVPNIHRGDSRETGPPIRC